MRILYMDCFLGFDARMLLGALIDAGAATEKIEESLRQKGVNASVIVQSTERSSILCKKATVIADQEAENTLNENNIVKSISEEYGFSEGTTPATIIAVICAAEQLGIDYIISSEISLPENTDGRVLELFERGNIAVCPADGSTKGTEPADAAFLVQISNENGPKPPMEIISIGYGAGGDNPDNPDIISAIIGEFESDNLFSYEETEEFAAYL